jgi:hypothetical protein
LDNSRFELPAASELETMSSGAGLAVSRYR